MTNKFANPKVIPEEIDFDEGVNTSDTTDVSISLINNKLRLFKNSYVGNKRKLIGHIIKTLEKRGIEYHTVLDLFTGSGFFSMAMKIMGKKVVCNDLLYSAYINSIAFVENKNIVLSEQDKGAIFYPTIPKKHFLVDKYSNRFSENEINILESCYYNIHNHFLGSNNCRIKKALAFAHIQNYIMEKCFVGGRLNNGQVLAEYKHRVAHKRNKGKKIDLRKINWIPPLYPEDLNYHGCFNLDAITFLQTIKPKVDLCYIDPPYGGDQSDYYKMYEFFEYYLSGGENKESIKFGVDKFINGKQYKDNFEKLIELIAHVPYLVISYNDSSWADIDIICGIVKRFKKKIIIEDFAYTYHYRDQSKNTGDTKEHLIIAYDK